jgi:hypothetical protein
MRLVFLKISVIAFTVVCHYNVIMKKKRGAPKKLKAQAKGQLMQVRVSSAEKQAFFEAASLCGQQLSVWARDQLRYAAQIKLQEMGRAIPFLPLPAI